MTPDDGMEVGLAARRLIRGAALGALATIMRDADGAPYASLVAVATDQDGAAALLLSDLADHTRNLREDARVSLLLAGDDRHEDPLAGERLTLQGRLVRSDAEGLRRRYLARHPQAALYADFADFAFYRLEAEKAHLVAGFGRIHWIEREALTVAPPPALIELEESIVAHMNEDHADAIHLCATRLLGREGEGWRMTGVDAEGVDLRRGGAVARLAFDAVVENGTDVRKELVRLVNKARET
jgi:putative heme iron utilization protein